eukprot:CAMPEP_0118697834 /NCGR_PEP_ID=MMETSP0800-20121206/14787_1 /TAXON_ID=210618 ORGANISM="Striatella unipunctata, Strain CCMP2910" /NCGR_SAMPLE_ID=MMETSP0800 /ASSEMBLY_ACC=CAM_ASM_000638 /LENGTH=220 /DNA_ID=CAMNT_0006597431 /DNA_START=132 /DNA_END=794 /DNA_ORIENTATION=-
MSEQQRTKTMTSCDFCPELESEIVADAMARLEIQPNASSSSKPRIVSRSSSVTIGDRRNFLAASKLITSSVRNPHRGSTRGSQRNLLRGGKKKKARSPVRRCSVHDELQVQQLTVGAGQELEKDSNDMQKPYMDRRSMEGRGRRRSLQLPKNSELENDGSKTPPRRRTSLKVLRRVWDSMRSIESIELYDEEEIKESEPQFMHGLPMSARFFRKPSSRAA